MAIQPGEIEYDPTVKMFYGHIPNSYFTNNEIPEKHRLIPAPFIDISTNFQYANDAIIGYSYTINLQGTVSSLDLRRVKDGTYKPNDTPNYTTNKNFGSFVNSIERIRKTLTSNGGVLIIQDKNNKMILKALGGRLKEFSISESRWVDTSSYTATLEFDHVEFFGNYTKPDQREDSNFYTFMADTSYPHNDDPDHTANAGLLNFKKYKLKSFDDEWKINFTHEGMTSVGYVDREKPFAQYDNGFFDLGTNDITFEVEYSLNAVGKQDFVYSNQALPNVTPAWQHAKEFCQFRLNKQVINLVTNVLGGNSGSDGSDGVNACEPGTIPYQNLAEPGIGPNGLLRYVTGDNRPSEELYYYNVFNESVNCSVSESEGSFSVTYKALIKSSTSYRGSNSQFSTTNSRHTYTTKTTTDNTNGTSVRKMSIQGQIQGLTPGGMINYPNGISLPARGGNLFLMNNPTATKYQNALECFKTICDYDYYNRGQNFAEPGQDPGKRDLKPDFKELLRVADYIQTQSVGNVNTLETTDFDLLGVSYNSNQSTAEVKDAPHPASFNITSDFNAGTINYDVTYSDHACDPKFRQVNIQTSEPVEVLAMLNLPGSTQRSSGCPYIQRLGTQTSKKITISINGLDLSNKGVYNIGKGYPIEDWKNIDVFQCDCDDPYLPIDLPPVPNGAILTQKSYTHDPIKGTYSINLSYVVAGSSCDYYICQATNF